MVLKKFELYFCFVCEFAVKKEMPKFLKKPDPLEKMEYTSGTFITEVSGKPKPEVTW